MMSIFHLHMVVISHIRAFGRLFKASSSLAMRSRVKRYVESQELLNQNYRFAGEPTG